MHFTLTLHKIRNVKYDKLESGITAIHVLEYIYILSFQKSLFSEVKQCIKNTITTKISYRNVKNSNILNHLQVIEMKLLWYGFTFTNAVAVKFTNPFCISRIVSCQKSILYIEASRLFLFIMQFSDYCF